VSAPTAPRKLRLLTGCTGAGKTAAALAWAERSGAEIVSCDALLFYRGMDIGTAKPSAEERARVPHHLIDVLPVDRPMDVGRYADLARAVVADIAERGKQAIVVGGSGFYLQSFRRPMTDGIERPPKVRSEVAERLRTEGMPGLRRELERLNPEGLGKLDTANPRRVAAALERCLASGLTLAELVRRFEAQPAPFAGWETDVMELVVPAGELERRIEERAWQMVKAGLLNEVRRLREQGLERNPTASRAIGYRESLAVLDGKAPENGLAAAIALSTRQLVKKQRTWFRTQLAGRRQITQAAEIG
jgi:tRNA dimethylallyltransferase